MWEESLQAVGKAPMTIDHDEYISRQQRLFSQLRPKDLLIITAPHESTRSNDVHYPYRTSSDMLYLCGWEDPEAVFCAFNDDRFVFVIADSYRVFFSAMDIINLNFFFVYTTS